MKPLPALPKVLKVARRVVWFQEPTETLTDPARFLTYVMTYGTAEDLAALQGVVDLDGFREALVHAPAGILDARSWAYWNLRCGRQPAPPMPIRAAIFEE